MAWSVASVVTTNSDLAQPTLCVRIQKGGEHVDGYGPHEDEAFRDALKKWRGVANRRCAGPVSQKVTAS